MFDPNVERHGHEFTKDWAKMANNGEGPMALLKVLTRAS